MITRMDNSKAVWAVICGLFLLAFNPAAKGEQRFVDNRDGTVTDNQLGVMWAKRDNQKDIGWREAEAFARKSFGSTVGKKFNNWRLPTLDELKTLYVTNPAYSGYPTECGVQVRMAKPIELSCILIWSSDVVLGSHMVFNFNIGNPFSVQSYDIAGCRVLPVRNLE